MTKLWWEPSSVIWKKAFDSINHDILISKMNFYGAKGKTLLWFKSYLSNIYQRLIMSIVKITFQPGKG